MESQQQDHQQQRGAERHARLASLLRLGAGLALHSALRRWSSSVSRLTANAAATLAATPTKTTPTKPAPTAPAPDALSTAEAIRLRAERYVRSRQSIAV